MYKFIRYLLILLVIIIADNAGVNASTIVAGSCSSSDVQSAINSASTGDMVSVPAGNCYWTEAVSIPSSKGITLQGAGIGRTNITLGSNNPAFNLTVGKNPLYRITGFSIKATGLGSGVGPGSCSGYPININGEDGTLPTTFRSNFRIDHIRIYSDPQEVNHNGAICVAKMVYGVMDNISIEGIGRGWFFQQGYDADKNFFGDHSWTVPLDQGGPLNVYVEDSSFSCSVPSKNFCQVYDGRAGGRIVFRYNSVTNGWIEPHAPQGDARGVLYNEIYENTFTSNPGESWMAAHLRGGTGVIFNNRVIDPDGGNSFYVESRRACDPDPNFYCQTYPCIDGLGRGPNQALIPVYGWGNTLNGNATKLQLYSTCSRGAEMVQQNRDYYNTEKMGYTPYTFPHPLRNGIIDPPDNTDVKAPQNVRLIK